MSNPERIYGKSGAECDLCKRPITQNEMLHCSYGKTRDHLNGWDMCIKCYRQLVCNEYFRILKQDPRGS